MRIEEKAREEWGVLDSAVKYGGKASKRRTSKKVKEKSRIARRTKISKGKPIALRTGLKSECGTQRSLRIVVLFKLCLCCGKAEVALYELVILTDTYNSLLQSSGPILESCMASTNI